MGSSKAYKAYVAGRASSGKRDKPSETAKPTGIPVNDHTERQKILNRLKERTSQ